MATVRNTIALRDKMTPVLRNIIKALDSTVSALASVDHISDAAFKGVKRDVQNARMAVEGLNLEVQDLQKPVDNTRKGFSGWQAAIVTINQGLQLAQSLVQGINKATSFADKQTGITSRLTLMTGSLEEAKRLQDQIMESANRSRAAYTATADSVAQMGMMASDAFTTNGVLNTDELVAFTEAINKQLVISGAAGTAGADAALYQLTQAMSSGVLRGDELRSIMEQAPVIADTVAKYMGITKGELREVATEGKVTSEIVKAAMLSSLGDITDQFSSMPTTFGQAMTKLKNSAIEASRPIIESFNKFIQSDAFQKMFESAQRTLPRVMDYIQRLLNKLYELAESPGAQQFAQDLGAVLTVTGWLIQAIVILTTFILNNWQWIGPIVWGIVAAMLAYLAVTNLMRIAETFRQLSYLKTLALQAKSAGLSLAEAAATMTDAEAKKYATAQQWALNSATYAFPGMWIILIIIAIIAAIFLVIGVINKLTGSTRSALGIIVGVVLWAVSVIWNTVIGVLDAIIQLLWTSFVEPWIGIIEWVLNVFNGGFNSFGGMVANLLGQIISWFLSLGKVVTKIIDAIFGTDWTGGLNKLQEKVISWGKNDTAITLSREAPSIGGARWASKDAYNTGANFGDKISNSFKLDKYKLDDLTTIAGDVAKQQAELNNLAGGYNGGITTQGEVSITDEDIKLLKDVAQAEWVNKYTTLRPQMNVTFGDVHETADAAKLLEVMEEMVEEAYASALTEG